jgi:AcrR family transcriptional regulator
MPRLTRAESRALTRAKLLQSASEVFAEKGYTSATIEEIAERAEFTRGAFYANFTDKGDLVMAILEEMGPDLWDQDESAALDQSPLMRKLQQYYLFDESVHPLKIAVAEFWQQALRDSSLRDRLVARQTSARSTVEDALAQHCAERGIALALPVAEVAALLMAMGEGFANLLRLDPVVASPQMFRTAMGCVIAGASVGAISAV